ncbi:MAG: HlyC/CorC family transporter, partial [Alphaproteobacteria bacterium]|nr:HlyC/CorC family transporter [Alphaproteobacteria bacterium]
MEKFSLKPTLLLWGGWLVQRLKSFWHTTPETSLRESIEDVLEEGDDDEAGFSHEERAMLRNLLGFRDLRVDDVMVPRADIDAIDVEASPHEIMLRFAGANHTRMPIFRDSLDQPLGVLNVKRVIAAYYREPDSAESSAPLPRVEDLISDILFVPPSMPCLDLLLKMQTTRIHLALVIDEYGGTDGLLTIEDLIEEIVGEIIDEDEATITMLEQKSPHNWQAAARMDLTDLEAALHLPFIGVGAQADVDTLGGLIFAITGRVPARGEIFAYQFPSGEQVEFVIRDGDPRHIKTIDIKIVA